MNLAFFVYLELEGIRQAARGCGEMVKGEGAMDFRGEKLRTTMASPAELRVQGYVETMGLRWERGWILSCRRSSMPLHNIGRLE